jgi:hypothetical protein
VIDQPVPGEITLAGAHEHPDAEPAPASSQLVIFAEGQVVRTLLLNTPVVTIGRLPANVLALPHALVSRTHAELRVTPEAVILTDLGSANGSFVDNVRLPAQQPVQLAPGTVNRIGPFLLRYEVSAPTGTDAADAQPPARLEKGLGLLKSPPVPVAVYVPPPPPRPA